MGRIGSRFAAFSEDGQVVVIDKGQGVTLDDEARRGSIILVHGDATDEKICAGLVSYVPSTWSPHLGMIAPMPKSRSKPANW